MHVLAPQKQLHRPVPRVSFKTKLKVPTPTRIPQHHPCFFPTAVIAQRSVVLRGDPSPFQSFLLIDCTHGSDDVFRSAKPRQRNFNAGPCSFVRLDEHKLVFVRNDQCTPLSKPPHRNGKGVTFQQLQPRRTAFYMAPQRRAATYRLGQRRSLPSHNEPSNVRASRLNGSEPGPCPAGSRGLRVRG